MKKISNKEFLEPLKNRPGLEPSIDFKNQLLRELQTVKPRDLKFKSFQTPLMAGMAAVLMVVLLAGGLNLLRSTGSESSKSSDSAGQKANFSQNYERETANKAPDVQAFSSEKYQITLKYPQGWTAVSGFDNKYKGDDGYLQLSAAGGDSIDIDALAKAHTVQDTWPFGRHPEIFHLVIDGKDARLIMPSGDQAAEFNNQSELLIKYPKPVVIDHTRYAYFVLYADKIHIREIADTISVK